MRAEPTRRGMLAATVAGSLLLAGCKGITALGPVPKVGTDVVTLDHAIASEELMVASYQAALSALAEPAGPGKVSAVVAEVLAEHQQHLAALRSRLIVPARDATTKPSPSPVPPALPPGRHQVLAALTAAERAASVRLIRQLADVPPPLAQLMASIGASEAAHVVVLAQATRPA